MALGRVPGAGAQLALETPRVARQTQVGNWGHLMLTAAVFYMVLVRELAWLGS